MQTLFVTRHGQAMPNARLAVVMGHVEARHVSLATPPAPYALTNAKRGR